MASIRSIESRSVHHIQSGQVIVDLCSVVKELVENSLDAKATSIEVRFKNHGLDSIEVQDNGAGIRSEDYSNIALKHYTSKLATYDDLATLATFGFRGEALSSLCAVSHFHIVTARENDAPRGTKLAFESSGRLKETCVAASPKGTTVIVEDIFHSLPVRRQELRKNVKREYSKTLNLLHAYACISTGVRLVVSNQMAKGKKAVVFSTAINSHISENIANVYGSKTLQALIPLSLKLSERSQTFSGMGFEVRGFISKPLHGEGRLTPDRQMFFVNSRPCTLPQVAKAFNEVYKSYNVSQSPFILADIKINTNAYDVNVSPDKKTILLHDQGPLLDQMKEELTQLFQGEAVPQTQIPSNDAMMLTRRATLTNHENKVPAPHTGPGQDEPSMWPQSYRKPSEVCETESETETGLNYVSDSAVNSYQIHRPGIRHSSRPRVECGRNAKIGNGRARLQQAGIEAPMYERNDVNHSSSSRTASEAADHAPSSTLQISRQRKSKPYYAGHPDENTAELHRSRNDDQNSTSRTSFAQNTRIKSNGQQHHSNELNDAQVPRDSGKHVLKEYDGAHASASTAHKGNSMDQHFSKNASDTEPLPRIEQDGGSFVDENECDIASSLEGSTLHSCDDHHDCRKSTIQDSEILDKGHIDYSKKKRKEEIRIQQLIREAERSFTELPQAQFQSRTTTLLRASTKRDSTLNHLLRLKTSDLRIARRVRGIDTCQRLSGWHRDTLAGLNDQEKLPTIKQQDDQLTAEERLSLTISKSDFGCMRIVGQFNLGFIIALRPAHFIETSKAGSEALARNKASDELFIIDQHASDEIYNFHKFSDAITLTPQPLVNPQPLELTAIEEEIVMGHNGPGGALMRNGFHVAINTSGEQPVGRRCSLLTLPTSRETIFDAGDLEELLVLLGESSTTSAAQTIRPSKVRKMLAMRACRSSIMVGRSLSQKGMRKVVRHMGEIERPWNCPHSRPTMRHLASLNDFGSWNKDRHSGGHTAIDWNTF